MRVSAGQQGTLSLQARSAWLGCSTGVQAQCSAAPPARAGAPPAVVAVGCVLGRAVHRVAVNP